MSTYRKEWPCCGDVTETQGWEPESCPFCASIAAPAGQQAELVAVCPNGWTVERVGDAMHIKRADGKWCGFMVENGPAAALMFDFLRDLAAPAAAAQPSEQDAKRLDWMIAEECYFDTMLADGRAPFYRLYWPHLGEAQSEWFADARAAIDASMAAATPEQSDTTKGQA